MTEVRLRRVVWVNPPSPVFDRLAHDTELTFLPMEAVWAGDRLDRSQVRSKSAVATGYTRFQDGDVLVPKITPTFEASRSILIDGLVNGAGTGTTELHVLRAGPLIDRRYLFYITQSCQFLKLGESEMYGVAGQKRVPDGFVRDYVIDLPSLEEQRSVVDFLDYETERLEGVLALRSRQLKVLDEQAFAITSEMLLPGILENPSGEGLFPWIPSSNLDAPLVRLGHVCHVQSGLTVDATRELSGNLVTRPYLRVANVQAGRLELGNVLEITVPASLAARCTVRSGDVLMTEGGDLDKLGRGTVWRGELAGCLHQNHVFALRPDPARLDGEYLAFLTRTMHGRCYFESTGVKTTNLASTSSAKIASFPVPLPVVSRQRVLIERLNRKLDTIGEMQKSIKRQLTLICERRQTLITAAVTGQIDVMTARGIEE